MTRILAVDDSRTMRSMLENALLGAGFEVDLAEDGIDGLDRFKKPIAARNVLPGLQIFKDLNGFPRKTWSGDAADPSVF